MKIVSTLSLFILIGFASTTAAAVPSPSNSTVPPCLVMCPAGDVANDIVVRDFANNPITASSVVLDFSSCASVVFCPSQPAGIALDLPSRTLRSFTDASGTAHFPARVGGTCGATACASTPTACCSPSARWPRRTRTATST